MTSKANIRDSEEEVRALMHSQMQITLGVNHPPKNRSYLLCS